MDAHQDEKETQPGGGAQQGGSQERILKDFILNRITAKQVHYVS